MSIDLTIVTPQGIVFQGPVESVVLPGAEGEFGVLENHERFLSPLRTGEVEIKTRRGAPSPPSRRASRTWKAPR